MSPPSASDALKPDAASVARFRDDLTRLGADGDRILVAVSGGPDSVALLLLASAAIGAKCVAATVDHGLRAESADEARWVARLCDQLDIGHATLAAPLPDRVGRTANLSARARALRYSLLEAHLPQIGARRLATAHHADDQLETMIMRLNRGAGIAGLAGVRAKGGRLIRPLLGWRRAELAAIVSRAGLAAADDPTNRDERFDRARLRKGLAGADWLDTERWSRSAAALGEAEDALDWTARRWLEENSFESDGGITLYMNDEPAELLRRLVILCVTYVEPNIDLRGDAVLRLATMLRSAPDRHDRQRTLGNVLVSTHFDEANGQTVTFTPAPPRRSH